MSSAVVDLRGVGFSYGARTVLSDVTLTAGPGSRLAVVGPNGTGKSTLLAIVAGRARAGGRLGPAQPAHRDGRAAPPGARPTTRRDAAALPGPAYRSRNRGRCPATGVATRSRPALPGPRTRYADALERWLALGGADFDGRVPAVLDGLGIAETLLDQETVALSGGQLARCGLAAVLLTQADVLLLDEPTNDLDVDGLSLLEAYLAQRSGALLVVSHDRAFLDRVATDVVELDEFTHEATVFGGGFAAYLEERDRARAAARAAYETYDEQRSTLVERARREKEWARQGMSRATQCPDACGRAGQERALGPARGCAEPQCGRRPRAAPARPARGGRRSPRAVGAAPDPGPGVARP